MRTAPVVLVLGACSLAAFASLPAPVSEPKVFFGEDWEAADGEFPVARAARAAFAGYLDAPALEDFEGARGRVLDLRLGGYGARVTGRARDSVSTTIPWTPGRHATSERRYYEHASDLVIVELDRPVEGVGLYAIDVGDAGGSLRITVGGAGGWERSFPVPHRVVPRGDGRGEGAVLFFGVVAPGVEIERIELRNVGDPGDGFGYDDLIVGRLRRLAL
jgi:hypothetical protein